MALTTSARVLGSLSSSPSMRLRNVTSPDPPRARCGSLLVPASRHQGRQVGVNVPGALGPIGADEVVDSGALSRPAGQRGAAPELHIVGMRADGERHRWRREPHVCGARLRVQALSCRRPGMRRKVAMRHRDLLRADFDRARRAPGAGVRRATRPPRMVATGRRRCPRPS